MKVVLAGGLPEAARNHPKIAISAVPTSYLHTVLSRSTERAHKASLITNIYQSHQFLIFKTFHIKEATDALKELELVLYVNSAELKTASHTIHK